MDQIKPSKDNQKTINIDTFLRINKTIKSIDSFFTVKDLQSKYKELYNEEIDESQLKDIMKKLEHSELINKVSATSGTVYAVHFSLHEAFKRFSQLEKSRTRRGSNKKEISKQICETKKEIEALQKDYCQNRTYITSLHNFNELRDT